MCVTLWLPTRTHVHTVQENIFEGYFWVYGPILQVWNGYCAFSLGFPIYVCCFLFKLSSGQPHWLHMGTSFASMLLAPFPGWWIPISVTCPISQSNMNRILLVDNSLFFVVESQSLIIFDDWCLKSLSFVVRSWWKLMIYQFLRVRPSWPKDLSAEVWAARWAVQGDNIGQEWTRYGG